MEFSESVLQRLVVISSKFSQLEEKMADPEIVSEPEIYQKLAKQYSDLEPIVASYRKFQTDRMELAEYEQILDARNEDPEMVALARDTVPELKERLDEDYAKLLRLLLPKDPMDGNNVILEIRAGTGGDEAALFAAEMFRAYSRFAEICHWKVNVNHISETGTRGIKEVSCVVEGRDVWSQMKFESGIHRVQRVPQTESQGRVHTSAITVAVLPEAKDIDIEIDEKDLRVDTYRSSGAGGQHVNTTDSAVRITHIPSGVVVTCQDERSKIQNKEKALRLLRSHLYDIKQREQQEKIASERKSMVGSGDRSEKIRTYNFPQGRVTDHRIKVTLYQLDTFMEGYMREMVEACRTYFEAKRIEDQFGDE